MSRPIITALLGYAVMILGFLCGYGAAGGFL